MADGVSTRNADESQGLSTQRAQRTQSFRNESRPFRHLRENESVERIDFLRESEESRGGSNPPQCKRRRYSKWKISRTIFVLRFLNTMCPPIATRSQSGGGGGRRRSSSTGTKTTRLSRPGGNAPRSTSCLSSPGGRRSRLARPGGRCL